MDKHKRFGSEEALSARVRELTAEVSKLRHELQTSLDRGRRADQSADRGRMKRRPKNEPPK